MYSKSNPKTLVVMVFYLTFGLSARPCTLYLLFNIAQLVREVQREGLGVKPILIMYLDFAPMRIFTFRGRGGDL